MIGNSSRLKLRILQLQNAGRLTASRFSKSGRVVVLTAICAVVLLAPTMQIETKAGVAVSPEPIELIKDIEMELGILGKSLETPDSVNTPETDFGLNQQVLEEKSELPEPDNEQAVVLIENSLPPLQQAIVQQDEEIEVQRRQLLGNNQQLQAQNQQQQQQLREEQQPLQEEQLQRELQDPQLRLQELNQQQQSFTKENQGSTYLLLNYSEIGPLDIREIVLTESESKEEFRIQNIQSLRRSTNNYILTDIKPGNYYVSSVYPELIVRGSVIDVSVASYWNDLANPIDIDDEHALIQVVENSINYIGDIRVDTRGGGLGAYWPIWKIEFSPNASTLLAAASDKPELFGSKDVVVSIASNDPVIIDKELLDISR